MYDNKQKSINLKNRVLSWNNLRGGEIETESAIFKAVGSLMVWGGSLMPDGKKNLCKVSNECTQPKKEEIG